MDYMTDKLRAYQIELPFHEQSKRIDSHYTSLIFPVVKDDFKDANLEKSIIDQYTRYLDFTVKMIKRDFDLDVSTGELMSVILQHPFFQSRWFSPSYCRDFDDSPRAFKDLFAGAIQNGVEPKWSGNLNIKKYVKLSITKGVFSTTSDFKTFIEEDLLPSPEIVECLLTDTSLLMYRDRDVTASIPQEVAMACFTDSSKSTSHLTKRKTDSSARLAERIYDELMEASTTVPIVKETDDYVLLKVKKGSSVFAKISEIATLVLSDKGSDHKLLKQYRK